MPIEVLRSATAHPVHATVSDDSGPVTGADVVLSVYDPATQQWMNMTTGAFQASEDTESMVEVAPGAYRQTIDVTQANAGSRFLRTRQHIASGQGAGFTVDEDLELKTIIEAPTAETIRNEVLDRILSGNHDIAGSVGALLQSISTGGVSAEAIANAVLGATLSDYDADNTVGEMLNRTDLSYLDQSVSLLALELSKANLPILNTRRTYYTGGKGDTLQFQFFEDDEALSDSVLATATALQLTLSPVDGGADTVVVATALLGGKGGYTLIPSDGVFETAGRYDGQVRATFPGGSVRFSEMRSFLVRDPL